MDASEGTGLAVGLAGAVLETAAPLIGGPALEIVAQALVKYGPGVAEAILQLFEKKTVTSADVRAAFAPLKAYEAYGIKG